VTDSQYPLPPPPVGASLSESYREVSYDSPNFDDELMVIKDFPHLTFNVMLKKLESHGINKMPLICALTPDNSRWSGNRLYQKVSEDHLKDNNLKVKL